MQWSERHEIVKQKIKNALAKKGERDTDINVAKFLGISKATYSRWKNNSDIPSGDLLLVYATKLNMSLDWLMSGVGSPENNSIPILDGCDVHIADTLRDIVRSLNRNFDEIARAGGMTPEELDHVLNLGKELPSIAVQKWVHAFKLNANFLLAQIGQPFLTDEEYIAKGPLTWVRNKRGDFRHNDEEYFDEDTNRPMLGASQQELSSAKQLIAAQAETIATQKKIIAMYEAQHEGRPQEGNDTALTTAHGKHTVAP